MAVHYARATLRRHVLTLFYSQCRNASASGVRPLILRNSVTALLVNRLYMFNMKTSGTNPLVYSSEIFRFGHQVV